MFPHGAVIKRNICRAMAVTACMASLVLLCAANTACGPKRESGVPIDRPPTPVASLTVPVDIGPPSHPVRLVFIHHNVGDHWLADDGGRLGITLLENNYSVSDTDFGWIPEDYDVGAETIGDHTDIGQWYSWFGGPNKAKYLAALFKEDEPHSYIPYSRMPYDPDPIGENEVIMFKSDFNNSALGGSPNDSPSPTTGPNPLRSEDSSSENLTVANAKGVYTDLLVFFETRQDKLFVVVTPPPLVEAATTPEQAANARALNKWLTQEWLKDYPYSNVAVFDFYDVLTSNGGSPGANDLGWVSGNHHRYYNGAIQYITIGGGNYSAYGLSEEDSLPTNAGLEKATGEYIGVLNAAYHHWKLGRQLLVPVSGGSVTSGGAPRS